MMMGSGRRLIMIEHFLCKALARMKRPPYLGRCIITEPDACIDEIPQIYFRHGGEFCDNGGIVSGHGHIVGANVSHGSWRWLLTGSYGIVFR